MSTEPLRKVSEVPGYEEHQRNNPVKAQLTSEIRVIDDQVVNSRGQRLFTRRWLPQENPKQPKAIVFLCHGYGDCVHLLMHQTGLRFANHGIPAFGIDYEGHGMSDGPRVSLENFDALVQDVTKYVAQVKAEYPEGTKVFLYGESMGGAVVLQVHRQNPQLQIDGAVLIAPMCKIDDSMKPPEFVISVLKGLARVMPHAPLIPTKSLLHECFSNQDVVEWVKQGPFYHSSWPKLRIGVECQRISEDIQQNMESIQLPLMIVHGLADKVTALSASRDLHARASSKDKVLKEYPEMWHGVSGEPQADKVFADVFEWIDARA